MSNDPKLAELLPFFRDRVDRILTELEALEWQPKIVYVKRTRQEQAEKVKQGYSKTMNSWHVEGTHAVLRYAGQTERVYGNAVDIVDKRYGWGGKAAATNFAFWKDLGRIAKAHGCSWGGDWKRFKDVAHIELYYITDPPFIDNVA